jgi:c-di-GMP phosphodiesterase
MTSPHLSVTPGGRPASDGETAEQARTKASAELLGSAEGAGIPEPRDGSSFRSGLVRNVRVGRQGIYDEARQLRAYALLFRPLDGVSAGQTAAERATSQVIASTFGTFGLENITNGRPAFINFTRAFLTGIIPIPVEPHGVVIDVVEQVVLDRELVTALRRLKQDGYQVAVSGYRGEPERGPLLELADYVKVDVSTQTLEELGRAVEHAREFPALTLVAMQVEDDETFEACRELGFELFGGPLLQRPTLIERRTLSTSQLTCVRLLATLADPDYEISKTEKLVSTDPGLTLRLLRSANSAANGLVRAVDSLRQALVIIGPQRVRAWVVLTLLEGGSSTATMDNLWKVLSRAFACQRLAGPGQQAELAFTIGLLSGAAELLGAEPATVADGAGVSAAARGALLSGDGEAGKALLAVLAHEKDDDLGIAATGLLPFDVSRAYLEALSESLKLVTELDSG